ncbi:repressor LexA [Mobiluncus mulieris ATCC 35239]|uniref:LexA repressor n=1 Tax=Mobiluncus mulieris ATCC 35239 TaxID=871571 RepID=E0QQY1_9ACTO|nr:transcriptional repressor LexA [Mobiluncus mulieris]EFM45974.1 repressor LexA [Mobiluncus mulieris ATCC 35239]
MHSGFPLQIREKTQSSSGQVFRQKGTPVSDLTKRQREVLDTLYRLSRELSYPPSVRELASAMGLSSPSSVQHHLEVLVEKGYLRRVPNQPRALEFVKLPEGTPAATTEMAPHAPEAPKVYSETQRNNQNNSSLKTTENISATIHTIPIGVADTADSNAIPLVGRIAAGIPITAEELVEDTFMLPRLFTGAGELFMLEVNGESMRDAAIMNGDWVVVRAQNEARNGDIVAAMLEGEATVKEFSRDKGHIWLLPHNPSFEPIPGDGATILGKVVTVIRAL